MNGTGSIGRSWDADGKGLLWEGRDGGSLWLAVKRLGQGLQAPRAIFFVCSSILSCSPGPSLHECDAKTIPSRRTPVVGCNLCLTSAGLSGEKKKKKNQINKKVSVLHPALISLNCISLILH